MTERKKSWFVQQPVGIRAAIIAGSIGGIAIIMAAAIALLPLIIGWVTSRDEKLDPAERAIVLIDLGYSLYAFGLGSTVIPEQMDISHAQSELKALYQKVRLDMPKEQIGPAMYKLTRSDLTSSRDQHCLDLGLNLGAAYTAARVMVLHRGKPVAKEALNQLRKWEHEMRLHLRALNILHLLEANQNARQLFARLTNEAESNHEELLDELKAHIAGALRQTYGKADATSTIK